MLWRDSSGVLAQRNGAAAQTLRVYNAFTDANDGQWAELAWSAGAAYLRPKANGTFAAPLLIPVTGATTVAGLPSAATMGVGARAFVTDAAASTFLSVVAGGGTNKAPVVSDGTSWLVG